MPDVSATHPAPPWFIDLIPAGVAKTGNWEKLLPLADATVTSIECAALQGEHLAGQTLTKGIYYELPGTTSVHVTGGNILAYRKGRG